MYRMTEQELAEIGVDRVEQIQTAFESFREYVDYQEDELVLRLAQIHGIDEETIRKLKYE